MRRIIKLCLDSPGLSAPVLQKGEVVIGDLGPVSSRNYDFSMTWRAVAEGRQVSRETDRWICLWFNTQFRNSNRGRRSSIHYVHFSLHPLKVRLLAPFSAIHIQDSLCWWSAGEQGGDPPSNCGTLVPSRLLPTFEERPRLLKRVEAVRMVPIPAQCPKPWDEICWCW